MSSQQHNSLVNCAKELFKPSKDSTGLQVCNEKNIWVLSVLSVMS